MKAEALTISQAARILNVHPETLRRYEANGYIASEKTSGGHRRYNKQTVEQLREQIINNEITSTPQKTKKNFSTRWLENKLSEVDSYKDCQPPAPTKQVVHPRFDFNFLERFSGLLQVLTGIVAFLLVLAIIFNLSSYNQGSIIAIIMLIMSVGFLFCLPLLAPVLFWGCVIIFVPFIAVWYQDVPVNQAIVGGGSYLAALLIIILAGIIISYLDDF